jgi:hypothetical protein
MICFSCSTAQTIDGLGSSPSNTVLLMPVELVELVRGMRVSSTNGGGAWR